MTDEVRGLRQRLMDFDDNWHEATCREAADRIEALEAEVERLREHIARQANTINIVGSPYHKAQEALDEIVLLLKREARAALEG